MKCVLRCKYFRYLDKPSPLYSLSSAPASEKKYHVSSTTFTKEWLFGYVNIAKWAQSAKNGGKQSEYGLLGGGDDCEYNCVGLEDFQCQTIVFLWNDSIWQNNTLVYYTDVAFNNGKWKQNQLKNYNQINNTITRASSGPVDHIYSLVGWHGDFARPSGLK